MEFANYIVFDQYTFPIAHPYYMRPENKFLIDSVGTVIFPRSIVTQNIDDIGLLLSEVDLTEAINDLYNIINDIINVQRGTTANLTQRRIDAISKMSLVDKTHVVQQHRVLTTFYELITEQYNQSGFQLVGEEELKGEKNASGTYKKRRGRKKKKKTLRKKKKKKRKRGKGKTRRIR